MIDAFGPGGKLHPSTGKKGRTASLPGLRPGDVIDNQYLESLFRRAVIAKCRLLQPHLDTGPVTPPLRQGSLCTPLLRCISNKGATLAQINRSISDGFRNATNHRDLTAEYDTVQTQISNFRHGFRFIFPEEEDQDRSIEHDLIAVSRLFKGKAARLYLRRRIIISNSFATRERSLPIPDHFSTFICRLICRDPPPSPAVEESIGCWMSGAENATCLAATRDALQWELVSLATLVDMPGTVLEPGLVERPSVNAVLLKVMRSIQREKIIACLGVRHTGGFLGTAVSESLSSEFERSNDHELAVMLKRHVPGSPSSQEAFSTQARHRLASTKDISTAEAVFIAIWRRLQIAASQEKQPDHQDQIFRLGRRLDELFRFHCGTFRNELMGESHTPDTALFLRCHFDAEHPSSAHLEWYISERLSNSRNVAALDCEHRTILAEVESFAAGFDPMTIAPPSSVRAYGENLRRIIKSIDSICVVHRVALDEKET